MSTQRIDIRQALGSAAFTTYLFSSVLVYGPVVLLTVLLPRRFTYRMVVWWVDSLLYLLRRWCRLDYFVEGLDRLPQTPAVVLMKHSSAWETLAQFKLFPRQTWVLKRELLWAPIFGWVARMLRPIAIDRSAGRTAVQQVIALGQQRLAEGYWVIIFPEGTRVPAGQTRRYGLSGALLASVSGRPVVPVAHNAGTFWPRRGWLKKPGTIRVVIGEPIPAAGREPRQINDQVQQWIEARLREMQ